MVVARIVVEDIQGQERQPGKTFTFRVEFTNGEQRRLWYQTDKRSLVVEDGIVADSLAETLQAMYTALYEAARPAEAYGPQAKRNPLVVIAPNGPNKKAKEEMEQILKDGWRPKRDMDSVCKVCRQRWYECPMDAKDIPDPKRMFEVGKGDKAGINDLGHIYFDTPAGPVNLCQAQRLEAGKASGRQGKAAPKAARARPS